MPPPPDPVHGATPHLDIAGAVSDAGVRRDRLGHTAGVLEHVHHRGQLTLVGGRLSESRRHHGQRGHQHQAPAHDDAFCRSDRS